jgi:hypothetical protein
MGTPVYSIEMLGIASSSSVGGALKGLWNFSRNASVMLPVLIKRSSIVGEDPEFEVVKVRVWRDALLWGQAGLAFVSERLRRVEVLLRYSKKDAHKIRVVIRK